MESVVQWYNTHADEYDTIERQLESVNETFMSADITVATKMLHDSYLNSLMSQQTPVVRHEKAFNAYITGEETVQDALQYTLYGNQKYRWYKRNDMSDFEKVATLLQSGQEEFAYDELSTFVGLSYKKTSFTMAMLGFTNFICIDTNVKQVLGFSKKDVSTKSKKKYMSLCDEIMRRYSHLNLSQFMTQWVLFDYNLNTHNKHTIWFDYMLD